MTIAKTLYQKVLLASLLLAVLSLFLGFFTMKQSKEGFLADAKVETSAQIYDAAMGYKTEMLAYNRFGIVDRKVEVIKPNPIARGFAIILLAALFTGGIATVVRGKPGGYLSAAIGVAGLIALYIILQVEFPEADRPVGAYFGYRTGFYLAIAALMGYIVGGILAVRDTAKTPAPAAGAKRFCGNCGADATNAGKFCGSCGAAIK